MFDYTQGGYVSDDGLPATGGSVYTRRGFATLNAHSSKADWRGWGYRKIMAKHGWGPAAVAKTTMALLTTPSTPEDEDTDSEYDVYRLRDAPYIGPCGAMCVWEVVVQRDPRETQRNPEVSENAPMGNIISAFGRAR